MEKLNNIFFALMTRGPDGTMLCFLHGLQSMKTRHRILLFANSSSYLSVSCSWYQRSYREGTGRATAIQERTWQEAVMPALLLVSFGKFTTRMVDWRVIWLLCLQRYSRNFERSWIFSSTEPKYHAESIMNSWSKKHSILDHFFRTCGVCLLVSPLWGNMTGWSAWS